MLIEAHDEWQDSDRRYLSEESMALLNPPAPTVLEPKTTTTDTTPQKEIAATASLLPLAKQHATSYTTPRDAIALRRLSQRGRSADRLPPGQSVASNEPCVDAAGGVVGGRAGGEVPSTSGDRGGSRC